MNFFVFTSLFIGFPPASFSYKPLVLLFLANEQYQSLEKNPERVNKKKQSDPGNDMTIADSYKLLNIIKIVSILDGASFLVC